MIQGGLCIEFNCLFRAAVRAEILSIASILATDFLHPLLIQQR